MTEALNLGWQGSFDWAAANRKEFLEAGQQAKQEAAARYQAERERKETGS